MSVFSIIGKVFDSLVVNFKNFFKIEINQKKSTSTIQNTNLIILNPSSTKEIIESLPQTRKNNVTDVFLKATKNVNKENIKNMEPSWVGNFIDKCKDVSEEDLKQIWAKILDGKINGTTNTSKRTMSVLSNLTSEEANLFHRFLKYSIDGCIFYTDKINQTLPSFPFHHEISILVEASLVMPFNVMEGKPVTPDITYNIARIGSYYGYMLYVTPKPKTEDVLPDFLFLTCSGRELAKFVHHEPDEIYLSSLSKYLKLKGYQLKKSKLNNGQFKFNYSDKDNIM